MLDAQEYLHLAIKSSRAGAHKEALEQLHHCLSIEPENATAIFLLAAEHAELGMYDRAIQGMERALEIDPDVEMAMLQLGMLYAHQGNNLKAVQLWEDLKQKTVDAGLRHFAEGFALLCQEQAEQGLTCLKEGLTANTGNPALNQSVMQVIESLQDQPTGSATDTTATIKKDSLYLGAYSNSAIGDR